MDTDQTHLELATNDHEALAVTPPAQHSDPSGPTPTGIELSGESLLQRFLQYVRIETTADDHSNAVPSTEGQRTLGRLLLEQLRDMGVSECSQNEHGIVRAFLPSNSAQTDVATLVFNAHLDTSPEASGRDVNPHVIQYTGGDIELKNGLRITAQDTPELADLLGKTLITTDGTTLLGGDDKAGVAIIMEILQALSRHPDFPRPHIVGLFTCDEEIGRGVAHVDVAGLRGTVAYTFDGGGHSIINQATFSADLAHVRFRGVNIHPSIAKDRMVNAIKAAAYFLSQLPLDLAPETTADEQGFVHPYEINGGVAEVNLRVLLRDFDTRGLRDQEALLRRIAADAEQAVPGVRVEIEVRAQYRNMEEGLAREPRAMRLALAAHERLGLAPRLEKIRGGTDGSQLTTAGLPTPNLSSGQHNIHSPREFACLEEMQQAVALGLELVRLWSQEPRRP